MPLGQSDRKTQHPRQKRKTHTSNTQSDVKERRPMNPRNLKSQTSALCTCGSCPPSRANSFGWEISVGEGNGYNVTNIEELTRKQETPAKNRIQRTLYALKGRPIKEKMSSSKHTPLTRHSGRGMIPDHFTHRQPIVRCKLDPKT